MKKLLLLVLLPFLGFNQIQIGADINGQSAGETSGTAVAIAANGTIVAVGATLNDSNGTDSGIVRVYQKIGTAWVQQGAAIIGEAATNVSGWSISLSADGATLAIGAPKNNFNTGHVRIYHYMAGSWVQQGGDINGQNGGDQSGWSVSLSADGSTVAIGSPYNTNNGNDSGLVRVYKNISGSWLQMGTDINSGSFYDASGRTVSLSADGTILAIGAPYNSLNGGYSGRVRIYKMSGTTWTQEGSDIRGIMSNDVLGYSVSLSADGSSVAIGAIGNGSAGSNSGHVKIFKNISGVWTQLGATLNGEAANDTLGRSVSLSADGTVVAVGANYNSGNGTASGHVRIYKYGSGVWLQRGIDINGQAAGDTSGYSVALSGDANTLIIGSPYNASNGVNAGQARAYDISQLLSSASFTTNTFIIYPNPTAEVLTIQLQESAELQSVTVYNLLGQRVATATAHQLNVAALAKGVYSVEVTLQNGNKESKRVVIQ